MGFGYGGLRFVQIGIELLTMLLFRYNGNNGITIRHKTFITSLLR